MERLEAINYWNKQVDSKFPHSAQAVLRPKVFAEKCKNISSSCGSGSCNCGSGCNGECGGE